MVLRCAWGTCNADERYPERLEGGFFVRFPTVKRNEEKCKRWIKACGRPHEQLNLSRINQHKAVCSKHFVGGKGPSREYPDPVPADGACPKPVRKPPLKRPSQYTPCISDKKQRSSLVGENIDILNTSKPSTQSTASVQILLPNDQAENKSTDFLMNTSTQTDETWISAMDILALAAEKHDLEQQLQDKSREIRELNIKVASHEKTIQE
ncbi:uncharacterized protein LOC124279051, partial [Haliotis rubra]|uniref:uncharacterized protein LOC124279051 n=1 Tax=Haliotis rubra TaxID=36100 RepID=UPI001EE50101